MGTIDFIKTENEDILIFAPNPAKSFDLFRRFPLIITDSITSRLIITDSIHKLKTVTIIKYLYILKFLLKAIIIIKQYAKNKLINFTNETTPSLKLSATINEMDEITTTKKNDKKCFLCLN